MAKMTIKTDDIYERLLLRVASQSEEIAKKALYAGAGIVADQIRENLEANLRDPESVATNGDMLFKTNKPSGDLARSLGIAPITRSIDGFYTTKVGFDGYDSRGVPNQLKARVMESGSSKLRKRPFVAPAIRATKKKTVAEMNRVCDEEIAKIMKG